MEARTEYLIYTPTTGAINVSTLKTSLPSDGFFWLDIKSPTHDDLLFLESLLQVHPLTIEDIQLRESREKCEFYKDYLFLSVQLLDEDEFYGQLQSPLGETGKYEATSLSPNCYLLVFANCLVSIHSVPLPFLPQILTRRIQLVDVRTPLSGDWLAYIMLDEVVDDFTRQVSLLQLEVDAIEDLTLSLGRFDQMDMLRRIYQAHRRTTILSRLIQPKIDIIRNMTKRSSALQPRTILYLRDVQDHLHTNKQSLAEFRDSLGRAHDNYLGQADIELAMAGHRMNLTVKKMTAITFMIGSAMAISSIMGMNIRVPFQNFPREPPFHGLWQFFILIAGMVTIVVAVFKFGRYKKWL
jgi:magnesium transporter